MSETFAHGYGLVIGVDDNMVKRLALPAVAKDVTAVYDVLTHPQRCAYEADNVRLLKGDESTKNNILEAFLWLKEKVKADPEATAVIYYSGHGMRDKKTERYYLIPYDIKELARVRIDALLAEEIQDSISKIQAARTLVILDCCHAQGMDIKDVDPDAPALDPVAFPDLPEMKEVPTLEEGSKDVSELSDGEGRAILNSSTGPESSYVRSDQKMSVFTYHLIEALTGHAPHDDEDTVVYVTDVMSWVTRQVKKTAAQMNRSQTPVMRTTGVFPVAQLIGGEGVALSKGAAPPDPLQELPPPSMVVDTGGGDFAGRDMTKREGGVDIAGDKTHIEGPVAGGDLSMGDYVKGDKKTHHEEIHGDKVGGDKVGRDKISIGSISGGTVAVGDRAQAFGGTGQGAADLTNLFVPLFSIVARQAPAQMADAIALKGELERGDEVNDDLTADLILEIADVVPQAKPELLAILNDPKVAPSLQDKGGIQYVLKRLRRS